MVIQEEKSVKLANNDSLEQVETRQWKSRYLGTLSGTDHETRKLT